MRLSLGKISGICLGIFAILLIVWSANAPESSVSAQSSAVSSAVLVTICGDGVPEGNEQCDNGKHCANLTPCTSDLECVGIGDGLCVKRSVGGCSATCTIISSSRPQPTEIIVTEIRAYPEKRSGSVGTNYDTDFYLSVLNADNQNHSVVYANSSLFSSNTAGVVATYFTLPVAEGTYDVVLKSESHLSRILNNVYLSVGENILNFTSESNSSTIGPVVLLAGDINGTGTSMSTMGDDVVNAIDLSILLNDYNKPDPSGSGLRANLNQDSVVNQEDLNILLFNLNKKGDI